MNEIKKTEGRYSERRKKDKCEIETQSD